MKKYIYAVILTLALNSIASAQLKSNQLYRWTDSNGVVHYTEYAPSEAREQILNLDDDIKPDVAVDDTKINQMRSFETLLVKIPSKTQAEKTTESATKVDVVIAAVAPETMNYCQTVNANLKTFDALEKKQINQLMIVNKNGDDSRILPEDIQKRYRETVDAFDRYCR